MGEPYTLLFRNQIMINQMCGFPQLYTSYHTDMTLYIFMTNNNYYSRVVNQIDTKVSEFISRE